jgi:hypothetical protein
MLNNHAIQMKFIRTDKTPTATRTPTTDESYADLVDCTTYAIEDLMKKGFLAVAGYVALDTIRKVVVARAQK